jgi:hypothetical protein
MIDWTVCGLCPLCRPESRGLVQSYLPAQLLVSSWDLEKALEQHPQCPDLLKRWLKGEQGVVGSYHH